MSYSEHRPGRFGSDGQIEFDVASQNDEEPLYLSDLQEAERRREAGEVDYDVDGPTDPFGTGPHDETAVLDTSLIGRAPSTDAADAQTSVIFDQDALDQDAPVEVPGTSRTSAADELRDAVRGIRARENANADATDDVDYDDLLLPTPREVPEQPIEVATAALPFTDDVTEAAATVPLRRREVPRVQRRPMRRLAILGGAEGNVLDHVPGETGRFVQMFFVLAGTALISGISMVFALTTGVKATVWLAIPLAIIWALIIFNLDRFLTSTMKASTSIWKLIALALPRVIMAAIIGIVVAEPLVLQVFANDIEREVNATNIVQAQSDQNSLETGPEKKALDAATVHLDNLQSQAATGVVAGTTTDSATLTAAQAKVNGINTQMTEQQKVIDQARAIYQCELTGEGADSTTGCTGVAGEGSSSDAAKSQLDQAQATYDALAGQLRTANDELKAAQESSAQATSSNEDRNREEAKAQLPAAQTSYDSALAAYNARAEAIASGNAGASGLLSQITALNRLADKEPTLGWAHWLIAALFFMIELLPVLVKVLTSYGQPSLYEQTAAARRQVDYDRITADAFRDRADIAIRATA